MLLFTGNRPHRCVLCDVPRDLLLTWYVALDPFFPRTPSIDPVLTYFSCNDSVKPVRTNPMGPSSSTSLRSVRNCSTQGGDSSDREIHWQSDRRLGRALSGGDCLLAPRSPHF